MIPILLVCCSSEILGGDAPKFTVSDGVMDGLTIEKNAYSKTFTVSTEAEWEIVRRYGQQWINISPASGSGDGTITISAEANNTGQKRRAFFDVKLNGQKSYVIEILQTLNGADESDPEQGEGGGTPEKSTVFPILAWEDIPFDKSEERFPSMKAAGINVYLGVYKNKQEVQEVLDIAQRVGVKLIVQCPELLSSPAATARLLKDHPALMGYFIEDEPEIKDFAKWGSIVSAIQEVDKKNICYINLYPNWAWGKLDKYESNVNEYLATVPVQMLSFDNYPLVSIEGAPNSLRYDWYYNLEVIMAASKAKSIPFWAFARINSKDWVYEGQNITYPLPTTQELRAQMFTNLAYGAQCLQYFTYWGIETNSGPTRAYERVKIVNQDIQSLAGVFLGCNVISVGHTGELPVGTKALGELPSVFTNFETSSGALVSHIENGDNYYLVIVNRSISQSMKLTISVDSSVKRVLKTGKTEAVSKQVYEVLEGDMEIFTWKK